MFSISAFFEKYEDDLGLVLNMWVLLSLGFGLPMAALDYNKMHQPIAIDSSAIGHVQYPIQCTFDEIESGYFIVDARNIVVAGPLDQCPDDAALAFKPFEAIDILRFILVVNALPALFFGGIGVFLIITGMGDQ